MAGDKVDPPVVLITGASSGLGLITAQHLHQKGYRVFGAARRFPDPALPFATVHLDVTDPASVERAVTTVMSQAGRIDGLVNNAGVARCGALEHHDDDEVRLILETNTVGAYRMCRAVLPHLRAQGSGHIINVTSLGGRVALPFGALYCASKFALEGLSESLRHEVRPFGVQVSVLEPGDFLTAMTERYQFTAAAAADVTYGARMRRAVAIMERDCRSGPPPRAVALAIERILTRRRPRLRYTVGLPSQRAAVALAGVLPEAAVEWLIRTLYQL